MDLPFNPQHLKRYKEITQLMLKIAHPDWLKKIDTSSHVFVNNLPNASREGILAGKFGVAVGMQGAEANSIATGNNNGNGGSAFSRHAGPLTPRPGSASLYQSFSPHDNDPLEQPSENDILQSQELLSELEQMGPTFVRLGQVLASRPDVLPSTYLPVLSRLGDNSVPMAMDVVNDVFQSEFGQTTASLFRNFHPVPLSVSPFGQTHVATLHDNHKVIVKVLRPNVRQQVLDDLEAFSEIVRFYDQYTNIAKDFDIYGNLSVFRKIILSELDFRQEAHSLRAIKDNLKDLEHIIIPTPVDQFCTTRILTMNLIEGKKLNEINSVGLSRVRRGKLAEQVFYAYMKQILEDGFVDGDPDPLSVLVTKDGKVGLLDFGMVVRIAPEVQERLLQLLGSVAESRPEAVSDIILSLAEKRANADESGFRKAISTLVLVHRDMAVEHLESGRVFQGIALEASRWGFDLPAEVAMLGTALVKVDEISHLIDPNFDANTFIHTSISEIMKRRMAKALSPIHLFQNAMETAGFLERLPSKLSQIISSVADNDLQVTVHAIDEKVLISGFQKIANRITTGLILAALIMGASNLMQVPSKFMIFGYPGIAMLCFLAAAGVGFFLVLEILIGDRKRQ